MQCSRGEFYVLRTEDKPFKPCGRYFAISVKTDMLSWVE
jgi:hypothetical protein